MNDQSYISSLVKQVRKKDALAMRAIYETHAKQMMATSLRITNSKRDSEDILQEAFIQSFQKISQLKVDEQFSAWLKRIVITQSLQWVKKRIAFAELNEIVEPSNQVEEDLWYTQVSFEKIILELQKLPDGCRTIFSLRLLEGYKHKEIAEELNISVSNSKSQYRYALKLLREQLQQKIYE